MSTNVLVPVCRLTAAAAAAAAAAAVPGNIYQLSVKRTNGGLSW